MLKPECQLITRQFRLDNKGLSNSQEHISDRLDLTNGFCFDTYNVQLDKLFPSDQPGLAKTIRD